MSSQLSTLTRGNIYSWWMTFDYNKQHQLSCVAEDNPEKASASWTKVYRLEYTLPHVALKSRLAWKISHDEADRLHREIMACFCHRSSPVGANYTPKPFKPFGSEKEWQVCTRFDFRDLEADFESQDDWNRRTNNRFRKRLHPSDLF